VLSVHPRINHRGQEQTSHRSGPWPPPRTSSSPEHGWAAGSLLGLWARVLVVLQELQHHEYFIKNENKRSSCYRASQNYYQARIKHMPQSSTLAILLGDCLTLEKLFIILCLCLLIWKNEDYISIYLIKLFKRRGLLSTVSGKRKGSRFHLKLWEALLAYSHIPVA
jgi:hypothetical protein